MADNRSALASAYRVGRIGAVAGVIGASLRERRDGKLVQISGWPDSFSSVCSRLAELLTGDIPDDMRHAISSGERSVFRVAPERLWIAGPSNDEVLLQLNSTTLGDEAIVTDISHSRTVLRISGPESETLLNRGLPIDLDPEVFPANAFAQSAIHHVSVMIHRVDTTGDVVFDAYVTRDLAMTFWEWLTEAAAPLGCEIMQPD